MSERSARWIAFAALLALLIPVLFLAGGLPGTEFSDGKPFDEHDAVSVRSRAPNAPPAAMRVIDYWLAYGPAGLLVIGLGTYIILRFRKGDRHVRRQSFAQIVLLGLLMLALAFIARDRMLKNLEAASLESEGVATEDLADGVATDKLGPPPEEVPATGASDAKATSLLLQAFFAVLALGASAALVVAIARLRPRRPRSPQAPTTDELLAPVEKALARLRQGRDAAGVVEECYRDMMALLAATLSIDPRTLTPREFARAVGEAGAGSGTVGDLTDLFELVHYGQRPDEPLAPRAVDCMTRLRDELTAVGAGAAP